MSDETRTELERAAAEAWPGCEINTVLSNEWECYATIPPGLELAVTRHGPSDKRTYRAGIDGATKFYRTAITASYKHHPTPDAAIAAAREQARERLRAWLGAV